MSCAEKLHKRGDYVHYESAHYSALELFRTQELQIFHQRHSIPITWRSIDYYIQRGVPHPSDLNGKQVSEIGSGLSDFALHCQQITIIDPIDYQEISGLLAQVSHLTKDDTIRALTDRLSKRAIAIGESPHIRHIQMLVEDAVKFDASLKGSFDVIISTHVFEHYRGRTDIYQPVYALGHAQSKYYIR